MRDSFSSRDFFMASFSVRKIRACLRYSLAHRFTGTGDRYDRPPSRKTDERAQDSQGIGGSDRHVANIEWTIQEEGNQGSPRDGPGSSSESRRKNDIPHPNPSLLGLV